MKTGKMILTAIVLMLLWVCVPVSAFTENRNIYVGDIITLEITSLQFSEDELREKFQNFEIIEIEKRENGYLLSIRTFDVGEWTISLGSTEIVINVESTLNDIDREDVFEGDADIIINPGFSFHWRIIFYVAAGIFVLSGCFMIIRAINIKKTKKMSSYQLFIQRSGSLATENDNYFVDLTFYFKEYLESLYKCRIIGKTSKEILSELHEIPALDSDTVLSDIGQWLTECDMLKFSGVGVSSDEKSQVYKYLLNIVEKIEMSQRDINEGKA